ncbi:GWT1-domain-containing protein [Zychaea mexicana]|uniref:GWT1-domain-containing protein n=1 Tax=Zychaea mexicana TaxID=64656 RepID=UPI0022FF3CCA|nr:GWT1-domain-containing protein [Zychaea mexicana]KAI9493289.1 GWT1-domain-containing protein [Zychaea mexicana]
MYSTIMMRDEDYKRAQEEWVSNCTGGSIREILAVCSSLVASHFLWTVLSKRDCNPFVKGFWIQLFVYIVPVLANQTVLADHASLVTLGILSVGFLVSMTTSKSEQAARDGTSQTGYKPYLTVYRAGIMMVTCLAILAVDFPIFPRRFAKVETFGTSLMDVGVGAVVFSSGIVSSRAYLYQIPGETKMLALFKAIRSALPILTLGFARFVLTKGVDYQHNSEYGLHWNFFFTLGFLPPFVTLASFLYKWVPFSVLGLAIAIGYQVALSQGLQGWILEAPRVDMISANKEGICSFAGYLSIFLLGLDSGTVVFKKSLSNTLESRWLGLSKGSNTKQVAAQLTLRATLLWTVLGCWRFLAENNNDEQAFEVSRRMANLPYVIWVVAFSLTLLASLVWIEDYNPSLARGPELLDAVNVNGLSTFLWANVLTGLVNLSMRTLYASTTTSLLVCFGYITVVSLLPWIMWRRFGIRVKL